MLFLAIELLISTPIVKSYGPVTKIMRSNAGWYRMKYKRKGLDVMSADMIVCTKWKLIFTIELLISTPHREKLLSGDYKHAVQYGMV